MNHQSHLSLYATVFLTGAAVMLIELLGTRIIAPFYGTSLYVWSALITVTMVALALGYFLGGILADRSRLGLFPGVLGTASLSVFLVPLLDEKVLTLTDPLGLRFGSLVSAFVLFMPVLTALGMASPIAIKEATGRIEGIGLSSGRIYAISTIGSVFGTLLLAYFLFPRVGSKSIFIGVGTALFLMGLWHAIRQRRFGWRLILLNTLVLMCACFSMFQPKETGTSAKGFDVVLERESLYGKVRVLDNPPQDLRLLSSDASVIGAAYLGANINRLTYQQIVGLLPRIKPDMTRALIIGQGAGHMASDLFQNDGIHVDTIELDPEVAEIAKSHFGFTPSGLLRVGDGRYEIRKLGGGYDLIIHDCFTGGAEPTHLLTVEALSDVKRLLREDGIVAVNFLSFRSEGKDAALASVGKTLGKVFKETQIYRSEVDNDFNDFILLASDHPIHVNNKRMTDPMVRWLEERTTAVDLEKGVVLTDDYNPLESMQIAKSEQYRGMISDWLGNDLLLR